MRERRGWPMRLRALLPGLWAGMLLCIALIAAPAAFATLPPADAGRVLARVFLPEAYASLLLGIVLALLERQRSHSGASAQFSAELMLVLGALFCTVAGYFAVQPMMAVARAGEAALSFGQLHAISAVLFAIKGLLVLALAWRTTRG